MKPVGERVQDLIKSPIAKTTAVVGVAALSLGGCAQPPDEYIPVDEARIIGMSPVDRVLLDYYDDGVLSEESIYGGLFEKSHYKYTVAPYDQVEGCGTVLAKSNLDKSTIQIEGFSSGGGTVDRPGYSFPGSDILTIVSANGQEAKFIGFDQAEKPVQPYDQSTSDVLRAYGCNIPPANPADPAALPELTPEE